MPPFPLARLLASAGLTLAQASRSQGGLWAVCMAPGCAARAPIDPAHWLGLGLGELRLTAFERRLRCVCGARQARLEVAAMPAEGPHPPGPFIFL